MKRMLHRLIEGQLRRLSEQDVAVVRALINQHIVEAGDLDRLPALFAHPEQPVLMRLLSDLHRIDIALWRVMLLILRMRCGAETLTRHVRRVLDRIEEGLTDDQQSELLNWTQLGGSVKSSASS